MRKLKVDEAAPTSVTTTNAEFSGSFYVQLKNKNGLIDTGKGWGLNLVYRDKLKKDHVVVVDYKHYDKLPDMKMMQELTRQINVKHNTEGYFNETLRVYFGL
ncbi:hypothetical protein [Photobacterium damselae]|uniref:hypothetical protein n=1 Tax=Photobacterium damselae TaxID=38293 RepID=UPI001F291E83|nr:hypothetical protein [Photobacterium damselae]UKA04451.1 hypothetical protein IHC89_22780 [Photobacterium damselae subsp. damselae]